MSVSGPTRITPLSPSPTSPTSKDTAPLPPSKHLPQTPDSPQLMSISTKSYAPSLHHTQTPAEATSQSRPQSTPPPTFASFSPSQQHDTNATNPFPTPADSAYGISNIGDSTVEEKNRKALDTPQVGGQPPGDKMDLDASELDTKSSTHLRGGDLSISSSSKDIKLASDEISLEQIQKEIGEAFLTCRTTLHASRPNPSEHLLSRYGLGPLVATVARTDPHTGEKINKLRKSYEGQIKNFGLAGRNKPDKRDDKPLLMMMDFPEQEWHIQKVTSKKIEIDQDFRAKLAKAMKMEPGNVKGQAEWDSLLGHEKTIRPQVVGSENRPDQSSTSASRPGINGISTPLQQVRHQQQSELNRPRRAGKKRSYDDNSFEGYGQTFDPEVDIETYSTDDDRGLGRKRRKKVE